MNESTNDKQVAILSIAMAALVFYLAWAAVSANEQAEKIASLKTELTETRALLREQRAESKAHRDAHHQCVMAMGRTAELVAQMSTKGE